MSHPLTLAAVAAVALLSVHAAGAVEVSQTVTTTAPPAKVAGIIGRFDAIAAWLPGVESSPADKGNDTGSVRVITLKAPGNPTVTERLTASMPMGYSTWQGSFQPAGGATDAAASTAVTGLYRAGLDNIKAMAER